MSSQQGRASLIPTFWRALLWCPGWNPGVHQAAGPGTNEIDLACQAGVQVFTPPGKTGLPHPRRRQSGRDSR